MQPLCHEVTGEYLMTLKDVYVTKQNKQAILNAYVPVHKEGFRRIHNKILIMVMYRQWDYR